MARFLMSRRKVLEQYGIIRGLVDIVAYSYKTNSVVWSILRETDSLVSISSMGSLKGDYDRVVYFLQGEKKEEVERILELGVRKFVVDNIPELQRFLGIVEKKEDKIDLFVRIKMKEHTIYTGKHFVYGIDWKKLDEILPEIRKNRNIENLGVHFHRKTQNVSEWDLVRDFSDAVDRRLFDIIDIVNIGGGIPVEYKNSSPKIDMILSKIRGFKEFLGGIKLMAEPGRFIAGPSVILEAEVVNVYDDTAVLDCSIFNAYIDTYLLNIRLPVLGERENGIRYTLKGRSPDSLDIFRYSVYLDRELKIGDKIYFLNAGAYNFHTEFNDMPKIETAIVDDFRSVGIDL
ncbi:MAG: decarboxylase [Candidatus Methanodesulfokora sp.]